MSLSHYHFINRPVLNCHAAKVESLMNVEIRPQKVAFYDDVNFPNGFRRCGLFTVLEAEFLTQNGHLMQALLSGRIAPENELEAEFVNAINNNIVSHQLSVNVWKKYTLAIKSQSENRIFMSRHCAGGMATNC